MDAIRHIIRTSHPRLKVVWPLAVPLLIWLGALGLRVAFVSQTLAQNSPQNVFDFNFDTREYVHLARNVAADGSLTIDTPESHFFALLRTPGYPVFMAPAFRWGNGIPTLLYMQAIVGSLIPPGVYLLAKTIFRSVGWGISAGLLSILSSTGVGLSAIILADLIFAVSMLGVFGLLYFGAGTGRRAGAALAGLALAVSVIIKPASLYFGPVAALIWCFIARGSNRTVRIRDLFVLNAVPLLAVTVWCAHNRVVAGDWLFCTVDAQNLRHFVAPLTQEIAKSHGPPDQTALYANHRAAMSRDLDDVLAGRISAGDLARRQRTEARSIVADHPFWAAFGLLTNSCSCALDGWAWTPNQLHESGHLRDLMLHLNSHQVDTRIAMAALSLLVIVDHLRRRKPRDSQLKHEAALACCAGIFLLYFFIISGTSFSTGFRILYPAEFAIILLGLSGIRAGGRMMTALARPGFLSAKLPVQNAA